MCRPVSPRKVAIALVAGAAGLAVGVLPALATDVGVTAGGANGSVFSPATVTIAPGDSLTWTNAGGLHNVHFDDDTFDQPASPSATWSSPVRKTFDTVGEYRYHCERTAGPTAPGWRARSCAERGDATPTPEPADPVITFSVKALRSSFCNRRTKSCTKPGVQLRITLTGADSAELRGTLRRRPLTGKGAFKAFGTVRVVARRGTRTYRFQEVTSGKRIPAGRYSLALRRTAGGKPGPAVIFRIPT